MFYRGTIESVLSSCITAWFGNCTASDRKTLQWIVKTAEKIIGVSLPFITDMYATRCIRKANSIVDNPTHPSHTLFTLMPSGRDTEAFGPSQPDCVTVSFHKPSDLEKAYDRVPREELWYCMRKSRVAEKYVRVVQDMYERSRTVVRCAVVMDQLSEEVRRKSPWTMMFADDIVICSESREQVEENLERWRSTKFLVHLVENLTWSLNTSSITKKTQQHLYFLRSLRKAHLPMLTMFYRGTMESILSSRITEIYTTRCIHKANSIVDDPTHPTFYLPAIWKKSIR
ncbi:hypothetical protein QTP86_004697 [Hemibagrus guttatus]|nr:hypothetical protein QTP86_004697 [Hemibagrus guttatus]